MSRVKKNKDKYDIIQKAKNFDKDLKKTNKERYDIDKSHEKDKWEEQEKYKARHNKKEAQRYEKNEYKKHNQALENYKNKYAEYRQESDKYGNLAETDKTRQLGQELRNIEKENNLKGKDTIKIMQDYDLEKEKIEDFKAKKQSNNKINDETKKQLSYLEKSIKEDKETGNTANRMKAIADQERYDRLYDKYKENGLSEDKIKNMLGERPKTGLEKEELENKYGKQSNNKVETEKENSSPMNEYSDTKGDGLTDEQRAYWDKQDTKFKYMMLSRMQSDADYYLGNGNRNAKDLWGKEEENHLNNMKYLYNSLKEKPEWLTKEQLSNYEKKMLNNNKEETFIQNTNMYGGTREYSKEDLDRMAEQGIRPMKNSYTGGGWEGVNSKKNLSTSEQAKAITGEMKKQFPDVKIARRSDVYSGGSSIDFNIMSSDKDLYISEKDIDKLSNEQIHNMLNDYNNGLTPYFDRWAEQNVSSYKNERTYTMDDVKRYMKEDVKNLKSRENQNVSGNEYYLSDYGKKVVSALNKEANSYTFDDSDGQIDYFHHGTYMDVSIGKWNKPYQVNESKKIRDYVSKKKSNHN